MLDGRLHRLALVFLMVPVIAVAAFSLRPSPPARTVALAPDAFDATAALADLKHLQAIPDRSPGSPGDAKAATFIADRFRAAGLKVTTETHESSTTDGQQGTVVVRAVRTGFSQRRLVIAADRATPGRGGAPLSGTATLLELARAIGGRTVSHTVEFVSTGAGPGGALAEYTAPASSTIAAIVLGDTAGAAFHKPLVVPWAEGRAVAAPLALERSASYAVKSETGLDTGVPSGLSRFGRLAIPLTTGDQGHLLGDGIAAVMISSMGEHATPAAGEVGDSFGSFGRSALRLASVLDGAPRAWPGPASASLPVRDRELPAWVLSMISGALILIALIVGIDAMARSRRRRVSVLAPVRWFLSAWPVFLLAWGWLVIAGLTGVITAVPASLPPEGTVPISWIAIAGVPLALLLGWVFIRPALGGRRVPNAEAVPGLVGTPGEAAPAALMLTGATLSAVVWLVNPVTALLILPFVHAAPWLVRADRSRTKRSAFVLLLLTLLPALAVIGSLAMAFGTGPIGITWLLTLQFAGGSVGILGGLLTTLFAALFAGTVALLAAAAEGPDIDFVTRGPVTYAGPGSLGGTASSLGRR